MAILIRPGREARLDAHEPSVAVVPGPAAPPARSAPEPSAHPSAAAFDPAALALVADHFARNAEPEPEPPRPRLLQSWSADDEPDAGVDGAGAPHVAHRPSNRAPGLRRVAGQPELLVSASVIVVGTPRATERLWQALAQAATQGRGELELEIPERDLPDMAAGLSGVPATAALRLHLHRHPPPDPELPRVDLAAMLCANPRTRLVSQVADALIVAIETDGAGAASSRHVLDVLSDVLPLMEHAAPGSGRGLASDARPLSSLPRAVVGLGTDSPAVWGRLGALWNDADALRHLVRGAPSAGDVRAVLRHLSGRMRVRWQRRPPLPTPLHAADDLPTSLRSEGERLERQASVEDATAHDRAEAWMRLAQLYRRANLDEAAGVLVRSALDEPVETTWDALPREPLPPDDVQRLRTWSLPRGIPGGIAVEPAPVGRGVEQIWCAVDDALYRTSRSSTKPERVARLPETTYQLRALGDERLLAVVRGRVLLLDTARERGGQLRGDGARVDAEADVRKLWRNPEHTVGPGFSRGGGFVGGPARTRSGPATALPRARLDIDERFVLCTLPAGVVRLGREVLAPRGSLERDDVVAAGLAPGGRVITVHRGGTIGRWEPGTGVVERIGALPSPVRDAHVAGSVERIVALVGVSRRGPELVVASTRDGDWYTLDATAQASSVRLSPDARRILSLEHRLLRVRACDPRRTSAAREPAAAEASALPIARTLLDPPPWMPTHIDVSADSRMVAVLARTLTGRSELRLNLWG